MPFPNVVESVDLESIITQGRIRTVFHPIISMRDQKIIGVEALSRGMDPQTEREISPNLLFEQARCSGRVLELDRLCRQKALENFAALFKDDPDIMLWLNFEPSVLDQLNHCTRKLIAQVMGLGIDPRRVVIEILESRVSNTDALCEFIEVYRALGFLIAIDDWGTAYSNMARLDHIKPDVIKIHRSLVSDLENAVCKQELIRSTLNLAHGIGALVVVEGVETQSIALNAMELGACFFQGFYFCRPQRCRGIMRSQCERQLKMLSKAYKTLRMAMVGERRAYFRHIETVAAKIERAFADGLPSEYDAILKRLIASCPEIECLYVLNEHGVQITDTVCSDRFLRRRSFLFHPPRRGADRSLGDFFLLIQSGLIRYVSEPYISRSTGNRCVTISRVFKTRDGRRLVICADCDCHQASLSIAHSRSRIFSAV